MKKSGWVRNSPHACGPHHRGVDKWAKPTPEMEEYLTRRLLSIKSWMNWVYAGTFVDHESVSESTIIQEEEEEEEEVMGRELSYEICIPCVVQWVHAAVLRANTFKSNVGKPRNKNRKEPRSCEHGDCVRDLESFWRCAHTKVVQVDNGGWVLVQDTEWELGHEQEYGRMGDAR